MPPITTISPEFAENHLEQMAENAIEICSDVFDHAPLPYAFIPLMGDIIMVAGGIKAGTELYFVGNTYNPKGISDLEILFKKNGLTLEFEACTQKGQHPIHSYFLYNEETLKKTTFGSSLVPQYTTGSVVDWINTSLAKGYRLVALYGKYFSYPESAISDFIKFQKQKERRIISTLFPHTIPKMNALHTYNETYVHIGEPKADVIERERLKTQFFDYIDASNKLEELEQSQRYTDSKSNWKQLHPIAKKRV